MLQRSQRLEQGLALWLKWSYFVPPRSYKHAECHRMTLYSETAVLSKNSQIVFKVKTLKSKSLLLHMVRIFITLHSNFISRTQSQIRVLWILFSKWFTNMKMEKCYKTAQKSGQTTRLVLKLEQNLNFTVETSSFQK